MSFEYFIIGILVVLMIAQNVYWAKVNYNLINRLMSRNYFEYATAAKQEKIIEPQTHQQFQDEAIDPESDRQAQELNTLFNMA